MRSKRRGGASVPFFLATEVTVNGVPSILARAARPSSSVLKPRRSAPFLSPGSAASSSSSSRSSKSSSSGTQKKTADAVPRIADSYYATLIQARAQGATAQDIASIIVHFKGLTAQQKTYLAQRQGVENLYKRME